MRLFFKKSAFYKQKVLYTFILLEFMKNRKNVSVVIVDCYN